MTTNHEVTPAAWSRRGPVFLSGASWFVVCASWVTVVRSSALLVLGSLLTMVQVVVAADARRRARQREREAETLVSEHAALRRVAALAATQPRPDRVLDALTREAGELLGLEVAVLLRDDGDATAMVAGAWSSLGPTPALGTRWATTAAALGTLAREGRQLCRLDLTRTTHDPVEAWLQRTGARWTLACPVVVNGRPWGTALCGLKARPSTGIGGRLEQFAELVGYAVAETGVRMELAASRARIVTSGLHARQRIERDLHDGVQQRLVSLSLDVQRALALTAPDQAALREHLAGIRAGVQGAVEELRDVAHGIHPSILSEGGLGPALATLARRSPISVDLTVRGQRRVPDEVELCVYYVASEALTNALKHARAGAVAIDLDLDDTTAHLVVRDDGLGGADVRAGGGLVGLVARVRALGGAIRGDTPAGHGTRLSVE